jgi:hypothetical protein
MRFRVVFSVQETQTFTAEDAEGNLTADFTDATDYHDQGKSSGQLLRVGTIGISRGGRSGFHSESPQKPP